MTTIQRITKNVGVLFLSHIITMILGLFFTIYCARYLEAEGFGILSLGIAFTGIFSVLTNFGLNTLLTREVSRDKSLGKKILGNVIVMKIVMIVVILIVIVLIVNLLGYPMITITVIYLLSLSMVSTAFNGIFNAIFQAHETMEYISAGEILNSFLLLTGALILINLKATVVGFALLYFLVSIIVLVYSIAISTWKFGKPKIEVNLTYWKEFIKEAWPMGGMSICIMIYFRIDAIMLSVMQGDVAVGIYAAAYRLSELSIVIPTIFMTSIFPILSRYHNDSKNSFVEIYRKSAKYLLYIAVPMALIVTLLAPSIINLLYGGVFSESAFALQILIWAAAIMYITMLLGATFVTANKQLLNLKIVIVAAFLNIILNLIIIPRYSYIGASVTTVVTEAFGLFAGIFFLHGYGYNLNIRNIYFPPLLGLCIAGVCAIILVHMNINILITTTVVILIYGLIIYKIGIKKDDKQLIKTIFSFTKIKKSD